MILGNSKGYWRGMILGQSIVIVMHLMRNSWKGLKLPTVQNRRLQDIQAILIHPPFFRRKVKKSMLVSEETNTESIRTEN